MALRKKGVTFKICFRERVPRKGGESSGKGGGGGGGYNPGRNYEYLVAIKKRENLC